MSELREYQQRAISALRAEYTAGRRSPVLVMPTGSGKTRVASEIMKLAVARSRRCLFVARRLELLDQCARTLAASGVDARVIQAGRDTADSPVVVASVPTLVTPGWADKLPPADLVIWDECHGVKARTSLELAARYPKALHLGLTATPIRADSSPLGSVFDSLVVGASTRELIDLGYLVPSRVFAPSTILDPRTLALEPVDAYERHCRDRQTIVFCATIEHAAKTAEAFRSRGVIAEHVSAEMPNRSDVIARYARGEIHVLANVGILIEGWDDPPTSAAIFARRFTHVGSYLQACGRLSRPYPGKTSSVVVDLCGSALVHGTPDAERTYSLDGKAITTSDRQAIRQCPSCGGVFTARSECPYCHEEMPTATRALPQASGVGVSELTPKQKPTTWPMRAKKRGLCSSCGAQIEPGNWIMFSALRRIAQHVKCAARRAA